MPSGEDDLIERYFARIAGPGGLGLKDDAALMTLAEGEDLVVTVDALSRGRHFLDDPPPSIARKALRVNMSDLAAKGATPLGFVLTLALPAAWGATARANFLAGLAQGLEEDSTVYECPLVGGDTIATDGPLTLSITAFGSVKRGEMVRRTTAKPRDHLFVTGTIGDAAVGLKLRRALAIEAQASPLTQLDADDREFLLDSYLHPKPPSAFGRRLAQHAHAAMDISDGFIGDISKMLRASGVGGVIDAGAAPFSPAVERAIQLDPDMRRVALTGGDDYQIAGCCAPQDWSALQAAGEAHGVRLTLVGRVGEPGGAISIEPVSLAELLGPGSYSHF